MPAFPLPRNKKAVSPAVTDTKPINSFLLPASNAWETTRFHSCKGQNLQDLPLSSPRHLFACKIYFVAHERSAGTASVEERPVRGRQRRLECQHLPSPFPSFPVKRRSRLCGVTHPPCEYSSSSSLSSLLKKFTRSRLTEIR